MKIANFINSGVEKLDGSREPWWLGLVKYILVNATGKVAAVLGSASGFLIVVAPELPDVWKWRAYRLLAACGIWLMSTMAWRQKRNQDMQASTLALLIRANPNVPNSSPDPAIARELTVLDKAQNGLAQAPKTGPVEL